MICRFAFLCSMFFAACSMAGAAEDEWEPYRKTGLFPEGGRWVAPDMKRESVDAFAARLLDGLRSGDAKAMATLGRLFYGRGDVSRAGEWLRKAAEAGHTGAQFDYGVLKAKGTREDLPEAYEWLWLATWEHEPGADEALQQLSSRIEGWQVMWGVQHAAEFQRSHSGPAASGAATSGAK
jgi:TPR repeat protein